MLLEPLFGGGNQSTAPSQQPSSGQSSGSTPTSGETSGGDTTTASPADSSQADPIYDEAPGDADDGTYDNVPPANSEEGDAVDQPAENTTPVAEPSEPAPVSEAPSGSDETEADTGAPVNNETGSGEAVDDAAPAETGAQPQPAAQPASPVASTPSEPAPEAEEPAPSAGTPSQPEASAPSPVAAAPVADDAAAPVAEEAEELRDFVTPFLADLETIRQRQAAGTSDARAESRNRAVAAMQDQLTSRLLDELSSEKASSTSPALLDDTKTEAATPRSLVERWYAEA